MATSDDKLNEKRQKVQELQEGIRAARAEREREARDLQNEAVSAELDTEIERLEAVLAEEKAINDRQAEVSPSTVATAPSVATPSETADSVAPTPVEVPHPAPSEAAAKADKKKEN